MSAAEPETMAERGAASSRRQLSYTLKIFELQLELGRIYINELVEAGVSKPSLRGEARRLWAMCEGVAALIEMIDEDFHNA